MNAKKSKALRRMAREEMHTNHERELVIHTKSVKGKRVERVINEPLTKRAMYLQLKKQYGVSQRAGAMAVQP